MESSVHLGDRNPLQRVYDHRNDQFREDEEFSDYVEDLLSRPNLKAEMQNYGVQWLKSKIRIERYSKGRVRRRQSHR